MAVTQQQQERTPWKLLVIFQASGISSAEYDFKVLVVGPICTKHGGNVSEQVVRKQDDGFRCTWYFTATETELDYVMGVLTTFMRQRTVEKLSLERVEAAEADAKLQAGGE
jgi:hypothetical protein